MFAQVVLAVSHLEPARRRLAAVTAVLGAQPPDLALVAATEERPATSGLHVGLAARSAEHVQAFWQTGLDVGLRDDGAPGPRPVYGDLYVGGFLLDEDGNSIEAALHDNVRAAGLVDHVWFRVADLAASAAFYDELGAQAGFRAVFRGEDRVRYSPGAGQGSFSVVADERPVTTPFALGLIGTSVLGPFTDPDGHAVAVTAVRP